MIVKNNVSGGWVVTNIDSSTGSTGDYTSIALDSYKCAHIAYRDSTNNELKYATNETDVWVITTLDTTGDTGLYPSIALDSDNKVHISYYDNTNGDLKYATNK